MGDAVALTTAGQRSSAALTPIAVPHPRGEGHVAMSVMRWQEVGFPLATSASLGRPTHMRAHGRQFLARSAFLP